MPRLSLRDLNVYYGCLSVAVQLHKVLRNNGKLSSSWIILPGSKSPAGNNMMLRIAPFPRINDYEYFIFLWLDDAGMVRKPRNKMYWMGSQRFIQTFHLTKGAYVAKQGSDAAELVLLPRQWALGQLAPYLSRSALSVTVLPCDPVLL